MKNQQIQGMNHACNNWGHPLRWNPKLSSKPKRGSQNIMTNFDSAIQAMAIKLWVIPQMSKTS